MHLLDFAMGEAFRFREDISVSAKIASLDHRLFGLLLGNDNIVAALMLSCQFRLQFLHSLKLFNHWRNLPL